MPSTYIGQEGAKPITPDHAPGDLIRELFRRRAQSWSNSRNQILACREMRRGLLACGIPVEWNADDDVRKACEVILPERLTYGMDLANTIGALEPIWTRKAAGTTDTDISDAEELEVFGNAMRLKLVDWDEIMGKASEDGQFGVVVLPAPAMIEARPDFMLRTKDGRKPNPKYDRDKDGKRPRDTGYGERSSRKSIAAWRKEYDHAAASNLPISVRVIPATDCVPILQRSDGRGKYRTRGLIVRTLMEREELIADGFTWDKMDKTGLIPRGFNAGNGVGQQGMVYLYEAYLTHVQEHGPDDEHPDPWFEEIPFVAYTVGGFETKNSKWGENDSAVINLKEEYGLCHLPVGYFFGMHTSDDDFDWRGVPIMWPVLRHILNKENLLQSYLVHTHNNAFTGNVVEMPDAAFAADAKEDAWLEIGADGQKKLRTFRKPKSNETAINPGHVVPWAQARVGDDARFMLGEFTIGMKENAPDASKIEGGDPSGNALVVDDQLSKSAKRMLLECGQQVSEFIVETALEELCLLERGEWRMAPDREKGAPVYIYEDVERVINGQRRIVTDAVKFNERWVGNNYKMTAVYPKVGNLAERSLLADLADRGYAKWAEVREAMGDEHPETSRIEIAVDQAFKEPMGKLVLQIEVARKRGAKEQAARLSQVLSGELTKAGFPADALAPEFQQGPGSPTDVPNMAENSLNGTISGQMGIASQQADDVAQVQAQPGVGLAI